MGDPTEVQGLALGPVVILGTGLEVFQSIKNEIVEKTPETITWVTSCTNDERGYAPDRTTSQRGGYAVDTVPLICGMLPYANIHDELVESLVSLCRELTLGEFGG